MDFLDLMFSAAGGGGVVGTVFIVGLRLWMSNFLTDHRDLKREVHEELKGKIAAAATRDELKALADAVNAIGSRLERMQETVNVPLLNNQIRTLNDSVIGLTAKVEGYMLKTAGQEERIGGAEKYVANVSAKLTRHIEHDHPQRRDG